MAEYGFRRVVRADLPMLADWLRQPVVAEWWQDTDQRIAEMVNWLDDPVLTQLLVLKDGQPIGFAQHSVAAHWGEAHYDDMNLPAGTVALDVFSGPGGLGHGGEWLDALARHLLADAPALVIDPDPANLRAIRAYQKAGFSGDRVVVGYQGQPARMMTRHRPLTQADGTGLLGQGDMARETDQSDA